MTDSLDHHVSVDITIDSVGIPTVGFGTSLIISHKAAWAERTRTYNGLTDVGEDWGSGTPEYRAARSAFSQTPKPKAVKIGRANDASVIMQYLVNCESVLNLQLYSLGIDGDSFDAFDAQYTSIAAATRAGIHRGLVLALNGNALVDLVFADLTVSAVQAASDALDFAAPHLLSTGDGPVRLETTGAAPAGLAVLTDYFVIVSDADTIKLAASRDDALEGIAIDITGAGSGTHKIVDTATSKRIDNNYVADYALVTGVVDFTFTANAGTDECTAAAHGLLTGDGPVRLTNAGGALPAGLATLTDYWIVRIDANTFKLSLSLKNALAGTVVDITGAGTGTHTVDVTASTKRPDSAFTVTADANGDWFSIDVPDNAFERLSVAMQHAAGTLDVALAAILEEDEDWYCLLTNYNSPSYVLEAGAWVQGVGRIYAVDVPDTKAVTTPLLGATDTLAQLKALAYERVLYSFHPRPAAMFSAGWMGRWLTTLPGKANPKFKTLSGIETVKLKSNQRANLMAKLGNSYELAGGGGMTFEGHVANTTFKFIDVTRNRDWMVTTCKFMVFGTVKGADIIPYTPEGTAKVAGTVRGFVFGIAQTQGVLATDPEPTVEAPNVNDIAQVTAADKAARKLRNVKFNGVLQGAVNSVEVTGTVSF